MGKSQGLNELTPAALAVNDIVAQAAFPTENPFGLVVNGEANPMVIQVANTGDKNYTIVSASASYHDPARDWKLVKNATTIKLNLPLTAGANISAPYRLSSELKAQEHGLTVWLDLAQGKGKTLQQHQVVAYNGTISVVEPPTSWFDPGAIFAFLVLAAALVGGAYFAFTTYFAEPQSKKRRSGKKAAPAVLEGTVSDTGLAGKTYSEDWIPEHHKAKVPKGRRSGAQSEVTSGAEATSGGESGPDGKSRRRKARK